MVPQQVFEDFGSGVLALGFNVVAKLLLCLVTTLVCSLALATFWVLLPPPFQALTLDKREKDRGERGTLSLDNFLLVIGLEILGASLIFVERICNFLFLLCSRPLKL